MRQRIFEVIEVAKENDRASGIYDALMLFVIIASLIPLAFKSTSTTSHVIDIIAVCIFIVDYALRWLTADYKFDDHRPISFVKYPFSFLAIIDLVSILPSLSIFGSAFRLFRLFKIIRLLRAMRVLRIFKAARYSKSVMLIIDVLKASKSTLSAVGVLAVVYVLISALIIFNIEPDTFNSFFDAVYWATISLTTVGYGDLYPITAIGKVISMVSSFFGIAIIALPSGIITAGYLDKLNSINRKG